MLHSRKRRHDTTRHDGIVVSGKGLEKERLTANRHFPWYGPISSRTGSFRLKFNEDIFRAGKDDIIWQEYSNCSNGKVVLHRIPFGSRKVINRQAELNGRSDFILYACVVEQLEQVWVPTVNLYFKKKRSYGNTLKPTLHLKVCLPSVVATFVVVV